MQQPLASYIDHTLLRPDATRSDIEVFCAQAREYRFAAVCVNPIWVNVCTEALSDASTRVCSVVGFPLGASSSSVKRVEAGRAAEEGAEELDMVMNIGAFKDRRESDVISDVESVVEEAEPRVVKVIIETGLLSPGEIRRACRWVAKGGADFVKTCTGFGPGGARVQDVALMHRTLEGRVKVKASGGIHSYAEAKALIEAGAERIGASRGVAIVQGT